MDLPPLKITSPARSISNQRYLPPINEQINMTSSHERNPTPLGISSWSKAAHLQAQHSAQRKNTNMFKVSKGQPSKEASDSPLSNEYMTPSFRERDTSNSSSIPHGRYQSDCSSKVIRDFDRLQQSDTNHLSLEPPNRLE